MNRRAVHLVLILESADLSALEALLNALKEPGPAQANIATDCISGAESEELGGG